MSYDQGKRDGYNGYSSYGTPRPGDSGYGSYLSGKLDGEAERKRVNDTGGNTGEAIGFLAIAVGIFLKFIVLYSPFILLGYLVISPFKYHFSFFYHFNFTSLLLFCAVLCIPSYMFFCGFHFLRAINLVARERNTRYWFLGYLAIILFTTVCPAFVTFIIVGVVFGKGSFISYNPLIILLQIFFAIAALYKANKRYDSLNPDSTPPIARWAFAKGKSFANNKISVSLNTNNGKNKSIKVVKGQTVIYLIIWSFFSYIISCLVYLIYMIVSSPGLMTFSTKITIISVFLGSSALGWIYLKKKYKEIFKHSHNALSFEMFSQKLFLTMSVVLFASIIFLPIDWFERSFYIALIGAPVLSLLSGIIWIVGFEKYTVPAN